MISIHFIFYRKNIIINLNLFQLINNKKRKIMGSASSTSTAASTISTSLKDLLISISEYFAGLNSGADNDYDRNRQNFVRAYEKSRDVIKKYIRETPADLNIGLLTDVQMLLSGDIARIMRIKKDANQEILNSLEDYVSKLKEFIERFGDIVRDHNFLNSLKSLFRSIVTGIAIAIEYTSRFAITY